MINPYPNGVTITVTNRKTNRSASRAYPAPTWTPKNPSIAPCLALYLLRLADSLPVDYVAMAETTDLNRLRHTGTATLTKP